MYYWCAFNLVIILNGFVGQPKECPKWAWGLNIIRMEISIMWMHTRCVLFSLLMQIDAWESYSDFVRNYHYTRTSRYCETVTYNCVLKRSETLFKGRNRHSFREIDNTKLHNTCNLSTTWKSLLGRAERGLRKGFVIEEKKKWKTITMFCLCECTRETLFNRNHSSIHAPEHDEI